MASLISWKKGDYIKLGKAIKEFNKKVDKLESLGIDYAPEKLDYKESKEDIYTRQEFNRIINSLKRFSKVGAEELSKNELEPITKWEAHEIILARNRATKNLLKERIEVETKLKLENSIEAQKRIDEIEATIESIAPENIKGKKGYEFKRLKERTLYYGRKDLDLKKASTFRDNFMKVLEEMKDYDNNELLLNKLNKIKNPKEFYEFIRKSEKIMDIFVYYKDSADAQTYGGFASNQDAFNRGLEELNLL